MGVKKLTRAERPPERVQSVRIGITRAQRRVLLELARQHYKSLRGKPQNFKVKMAAETVLHMACGLKPSTFQSVIRYVCRYGNAEGFNHFFLLDQMAIGALAEWRRDASRTEGLRPPDGNNGAAKMERLNPDELLALWRKEMDREEMRETIETLKMVAAGLEQSLGGDLKP